MLNFICLNCIQPFCMSNMNFINKIDNLNQRGQANQGIGNIVDDTQLLNSLIQAIKKIMMENGNNSKEDTIEVMNQNVDQKVNQTYIHDNSAYSGEKISEMDNKNIYQSIQKNQSTNQEEKYLQEKNNLQKNQHLSLITKQNINKNIMHHSVTISNKKSLSKSKYGEHFRQHLDPRDQILAHPFEFILEIPFQVNSNELNSKIYHFDKKSKAYQILCNYIEQYLVDVVENVVSISFNYLMEGKLKDSQSKDYASKNILLNVHSIIKQVMKTLVKEQIIAQKSQQQLLLKQSLCQLANNTLKQVLKNITPYYPQAPSTGGTHKMRKTLLSIDRNSNQQMDFLFTQNLRLTKQDDGDYTQYIMRVVNRAIQVTSEISNTDPLHQTLFQKFVAFSEHLFWVSQEDSFQNPIDSLENMESDQNLKQQKTLSKDQQLNIKKLQMSDQDLKQKILDYMKKPICKQFQKVQLIDESKKQKMMDEMKRRHDFAIGQKIPSNCCIFSQKDIINKNFSVKNSAILRILTKWAENLEDIFNHPQIHVTKRIYPLKKLDYQLLTPQRWVKQELIKQIAEKKKEKQKLKQHLMTQNKKFQSIFLAQDNSQSKDISQFIKRYSETRVMASKMKALLIQFMRQYVSSLIHLLVQAGHVELKEQGITYQHDINLVVFKIGDLMRSKFHCNEATFIRLLKTLYILDEANDHGEQIFKLVRIKNKLDTKDNNILINYLFMGKVQCELQMSIQKMASKEENYYNFSHFLYELTRGKFGVLSECATIISQHDPIVSSSSSSDQYYEPKTNKRQQSLSIQANELDLNDQYNQQNNEKSPVKQQIAKSQQIQNKKQEINNIFVCQHCDKLKLSQNEKLLKRSNLQQSICNDCLIINQHIKNKKIIQKKLFLAQKLLTKRKISDWILQQLQNGQIKRLNNYRELGQQKQQSNQLQKQIQPIKIVICINQKKNVLQFSLFGKQKSQGIFYLSEITANMCLIGPLNGDKIQYKDITQKIHNLQKMPKYTYISQESTSINLKISEYLKFIKPQEIEDKLIVLNKKCRQKIMKDSILNILTNKNQSLLFNSKQKLQIMSTLVDDNSKNKLLFGGKQILKILSQIKFITALQIDMVCLPSWLSMCKNIKNLNLSFNKIKDISILYNFIEMKDLNLTGNQIEYIKMQKLAYLEKLRIRKNKIQSISFENIESGLQSENINSFQNKQIQNTATKINCLKLFDFAHNSLTSINITALISLQYLFGYGNKLQSFEYSQHSSLKDIRLFDNNFTSLVISDLPSLQELHLESSKLQNFEYSNLPSLKILRLDENNFTSLVTSDLPSLQELSLEKNKLQKFEYRNLPALKILDLYQNKFTTLKIQDMPSLQQLDADDNQDLQLFSLQNCPSLFSLSVARTNLAKIQLIDFPILTQVWIQQNPRLTELSFKKLPAIDQINMQSLIPTQFADICFSEINQEGVSIQKNPQMKQWLKIKFPNVIFKDS